MSNPPYLRAKLETTLGRVDTSSRISARVSATKDCGAEPSMAMDTRSFDLTFATFRLEPEVATQRLDPSCTNQIGTV
jgi:hypothetical protein